MHNYKAQILSKNTILATYNNFRFSDEAINDFIKNQPVVPVTVNFKDTPIGATRSFELDGDRVICSFEIEIPDMEELGLFAVPSGIVNHNDISQEDENGVKTIMKMQLTEVAITATPADPSLTKIEKG